MFDRKDSLCLPRVRIPQRIRALVIRGRYSLYLVVSGRRRRRRRRFDGRYSGGEGGGVMMRLPRRPARDTVRVLLGGRYSGEGAGRVLLGGRHSGKRTGGARCRLVLMVMMVVVMMVMMIPRGQPRHCAVIAVVVVVIGGGGGRGRDRAGVLFRGRYSGQVAGRVLLGGRYSRHRVLLH